MQLLGGVWTMGVCRWGMSPQAGFSQRFAEDRTRHVKTFTGAIGEERSKELAFSLEKEEEGVG